MKSVRDILNERNVKGLTIGTEGENLTTGFRQQLEAMLDGNKLVDVALDLDGAPKVEKDGDVVLSIQLKLKPAAAAALEQLSGKHVGKHVAIIVGDEVVTMHRIRQAIKGGELQITSCAPGAANHLLEQLQVHARRR